MSIGNNWRKAKQRKALQKFYAGKEAGIQGLVVENGEGMRARRSQKDRGEDNATFEHAADMVGARTSFKHVDWMTDFDDDMYGFPCSFLFCH